MTKQDEIFAQNAYRWEDTMREVKRKNGNSIYIYIYIYMPKRKCFWNAAQVCGKDEAGQTVKLQITLLKSKKKKKQKETREQE